MQNSSAWRIIPSQLLQLVVSMYRWIMEMRTIRELVTMLLFFLKNVRVISPSKYTQYQIETSCDLKSKKQIPPMASITHPINASIILLVASFFFSRYISPIVQAKSFRQTFTYIADTTPMRPGRIPSPKSPRVFEKCRNSTPTKIVYLQLSNSLQYENRTVLRVNERRFSTARQSRNILKKNLRGQ